MFGKSQGVPVHRWIGFILFKNQSTLKKNKLIKCKTTNSAGTIVSQCAQLESSQSAVGAIYGSQNCFQVPQHLTSIFQLIMLDSAIPAEVSCTYDMTWTFVMCMFMLEIECKAKRLLYNENQLLMFWWRSTETTIILQAFLRPDSNVWVICYYKTRVWHKWLENYFRLFFVMQIFWVGGSVKL